MKVLVDESGYVTDYAVVGEIDGAADVATPEDLQHFSKCFKAYRMDGDNLVFDTKKSADNEREDAMAEFRRRRTNECFSVINRGVLWHETLTVEQANELRKWYQAWLDVTDTFVVPENPSWLK